MRDSAYNTTGSEIAVIGMAGRFPGAENIHEFWENLKNGIESLSFISDEELETLELPPGWKENPNYVRAKGGQLKGKECFDASFFGYTQREAEIMDPQMRIFHECAWTALEDAGYDTAKYRGAVGLYVGGGTSGFWEYLTLSSGKCEALGFFASSLLYDKDYLSTKIAYNLDLKGPCFSVQTACSTSLVAIHLACQGILNGECNMALAGGIKIIPQNAVGYIYQQGMLYSPDGHCRAFDAGARGMIVGEGAGAVLLKSLEEAVSDGDHIYAVIKGTAINNDGLRKVGYTAPSIEGQADVIATAHRVAEVEPESIGYIEAHGTGTELGDPVEIEALRSAFNTPKKQFAALGSVKTNIGHLDAAAGAAGFIKTVLVLKYRLIPPSLNYKSPNPRIDFENSPFFVNDRLREWKQDGYPRRAGVSSFGIGGTNAHAVLEEWPSDRDRQTADRLTGNRTHQLLLLSGKTPGALDRVTENLRRYFKIETGISLSDAAYTLALGRRELECRRVVVCEDGDQAVEALSTNGSADSPGGHTVLPGPEEPPVIFMFPGLGAHYENMGEGLYREEPVFREAMDNCFRILEHQADFDIKEILYPGEGDTQSRGKGMPGLTVARLAVFIVEYALARVLIKWGVTPDAMLGYGFGEYAAACLPGEVSLEHTLKSILTIGTSAGTPTAGHFADGIKETMGKENAVFIEVGPGRDLGRLVESFAGSPGCRVLNLMRSAEEDISDTRYLLNAVGQLWLYGGGIDWEQFYSGQTVGRIPLPTYPFERRRYWFDEGVLKKGVEILGGGGGQKETVPGTGTTPVLKPRPQLITPYAAPGNEIEEALAREWRHLFGCDRIGIDDNFYDLGGDSVMAVNLVSLVNKAGYPLALAHILANPTIRKLASVVNERDISEEREQEIYENRVLSQLECIEKLTRGRKEKNIFIIHALHGMVNQYNELAALLGKEYNVYGVQARGLQPGSKLPEHPDQMIDHYLEQILAVQNDGPFILAGYCNGNKIAYAIARKLEALNHRVKKVIFLDSFQFLTDLFIRIVRTLEHLPVFFNKILIADYNRKFKKVLREWKQRIPGGGDGSIRTDAINNKLFENHMEILSKHILPLRLIKSPILSIVAERTTNIRVTEADFGKMTRGKAAVVKTPGDHDSLFDKPDVENVAKIILEHTR